jgi:serine/threonine-protein kinase
MYQTLNAIPPSPSSINPAVPDMLNFIVAKALAKDLENRYQNARDLANDLRACRGTVPSSAVTIDATKSAIAGLMPEAAKGVKDSEDESEPVLTMRLSPSFDSAGATMRLAAMTASQEDVEELSRTFKMNRPSAEEINSAAPRSQSRHVSPTGGEARTGRGGGLILMVIIALILIGLISAFFF